MMSVIKLSELAKKANLSSSQLGRGLKYHPEILQEYLLGATIQQRIRGGNWFPDEEPTFRINREYRVAPS